MIYLKPFSWRSQTLILRCFFTRDKCILFRAFTAYVRPLVEYCCSVWSPYQWTLIYKLERIQPNFTKELFSLEHLMCIDRLHVLNADTLEIRRLKADLLFYYKISHTIFHKLVDLEEVVFSFVITRILVAIILYDY